MKKVIQVAVKEPQYVVSTDVAFAQVDAWFGHTVRDLKLDVIYPEHTEKRPCIVWICGGAWLQMSVSAHLAYLCDLAREGFVVASVQYRTSNEAVFPAQLEDVKAAIRYLKAHSERYGIDPERFGVMGESAGGHLTVMTALTGGQCGAGSLLVVSSGGYQQNAASFRCGDDGCAGISDAWKKRGIA